MQKIRDLNSDDRSKLLSELQSTNLVNTEDKGLLSKILTGTKAEQLEASVAFADKHGGREAVKQVITDSVLESDLLKARVASMSAGFLAKHPELAEKIGAEAMKELLPKFAALEAKYIAKAAPVAGLAVGAVSTVDAFSEGNYKGGLYGTVSVLSGAGAIGVQANPNPLVKAGGAALNVVSYGAMVGQLNADVDFMLNKFAESHPELGAKAHELKGAIVDYSKGEIKKAMGYGLTPDDHIHKNEASLTQINEKRAALLADTALAPRIKIRGLNTLDEQAAAIHANMQQWGYVKEGTTYVNVNGKPTKVTLN